jgi:NADPH-dependent glutamate synthase beta subunit-like oxidoreductase
MPTITIDGQAIRVASGTTILDAAAELGIEIPTLCYLKGYEPSTSCQVCLIRNRITGQLMPACATKVLDDMDIESESEDVHAMRRTALELLFSDHIGDCLAPCFFACPAHMDIPLMLQQIGQHEIQEAIATIKRDIALPAVLGRVCSKPCEKGCRRKGADDPVAVCELKRYVADADLESEEPYLPECKADSGKSVAIVGAGSAGLSAAYYLRQEGHQCVLLEKDPKAGGRLRNDYTSAELPPEILDREIEQIIRLGVELRTDHAVTSTQDLEALCTGFDAVLLACGSIDDAQATAWNLKSTRRGLHFDRNSFATSREGVFAAGCAIRGDTMVVRSVADGKEAASCVDQFVRGERVRLTGRPFSSRMGRVAEDEMQEFLAGAESCERQTPPAAAEYDAQSAADQSDRCLACGCAAHGNCRLEDYAQMYGVDPNRFGGQRHTYQVVDRDCSVLFEPGKCIKCELCVQIAARAGEPLGLTFVGRGFDVQLSVPFQHSLDEALQKVAEQCVAACPTGALMFSDGRHARASCGLEGCPQAAPADE